MVKRIKAVLRSIINPKQFDDVVVEYRFGKFIKVDK